MPNLVFLSIQPSFATEKLCQPCTRNVLSEYIQFTSSLPYTPGISNSPLMGGETELYKVVREKCGTPFLSGSVQAAGFSRRCSLVQTTDVRNRERHALRTSGAVFRAVRRGRREQDLH